MQEEDCYAVLGVEAGASAAEIKRAFRLKAKSLHPDVTGKKADGEAMSRVLRAYKILSSALQRAEFNAFYGKYKKAETSNESFDFRSWLSQRSDPESRARLIFFDLLHDREADAIDEYHVRRDTDCTFSLEPFFDREDFMDCGFILAEELSFAGDFYESFRLLARIMQLEQEKPYFRHFYPEVVILMRDILRNKLPGTIGDDLLIDCYEDALELKLEKKDEAVCFRRMAEAFDRIGDTHAATVCFNEAMRLDPAAAGLVSLKKKLGDYI